MKRNDAIILILSFLLCSGSAAIAGWNIDDEDKKATLSKSNEFKVSDTIAKFKKKDPEMIKYFDQAYGYAVFPTVGKGGIGIGGAYGKGVVYEKGEAIGKTSLKQISYGFQLGGQSYSEIIFFKNKVALGTFIEGNFEFGAGVSAVAVTAGVSTDLDYSNGVAVVTMVKGGLMYEATISGQKFNYKPYK